MFESGVRLWDGVLAPHVAGESLREEIAALSARAACGLASDNQLVTLAVLHLRAGNPGGALMAVLPLLSRERPPAHALYLRGLVRLRGSDPRGVYDLLEAAGRAPMLMGRAVARVEVWLSGAGRAHDAPELRETLARLKDMHEAARRERRSLSGQIVLRPPGLDEADMELLRERLRPFRGRFRAAWLAERVCDHFPVWRHHELLLDIPLTACWPLRGLSRRMEKLRREARAALPLLMESTIGVRVFASLSRRHAARQIRLACGLPFMIGAPSSGKEGGGMRVADDLPEPENEAESRC